MHLQCDEPARRQGEQRVRRRRPFDGRHLVRPSGGFCQVSCLGISRGSRRGASHSSGFQATERDGCPAHVVKAPCRGGNRLAHVRSAAGKVSELIVASAISLCRSGALEAEHRSTSALDAAVILLKAVVEVAVRPMQHMRAKRRSDRPRIRVVAVRRDPVRQDASGRLRRSKEDLGDGEIAVFPQHHVDEGAIAIDCAVEILPAAVHPDVRLVDVPATAYFALPSPPEILRQCRRELCLPIANGLIAEREATDQEHLGQISQAELVAEPPEHHKSDDIARVLRPVQQAGAPLLELLRAGQAAEPPIALCRALRPFLNGGRLRFRATRLALTPQRGGS